jgi:DNA (cytosine-5)-methyltransferase 1
MASKKKTKIYAVDLFCGVGGLTSGLQTAGINVRLGIDIDPSCKLPYTVNNRACFLLKSIEKVTANEIIDYFPKNGVRLLAGCAPCQTFSSYNQKATSEDERWWLLQEFARLIQEIEPDIVTMENVPLLQKQNIFDDFMETLLNLGYYVEYQIVHCEDYGIPQTRKRLVLLASKLGPINLMSSENYGAEKKTVREAIGSMMPIQAGETCLSDSLHRSAILSKTNLTRIKNSRSGGTWRDWDIKLRAGCHIKSSGKTYSSVYGRMSWDAPAPTITTQFFGFGNGRFGHPEQDRAISLREGAILQSFPKDYRFVADSNPFHFKTIGRLIGNAVPPMLGEVIGKSIVAHVTSHNSGSSCPLNNRSRH